MLDFDERDLVRLAEHAGFGEVHAQLAIDIHPPEPLPWDAMLNSSGNPRIPTPAEAMRQALTVEEVDRLTAHLRPLVEQGCGKRRTATAYLWGSGQRDELTIDALADPASALPEPGPRPTFRWATQP